MTSRLLSSSKGITNYLRLWDYWSNDFATKVLKQCFKITQKSLIFYELRTTKLATQQRVGIVIETLTIFETF